MTPWVPTLLFYSALNAADVASFPPGARETNLLMGPDFASRAIVSTLATGLEALADRSLVRAGHRRTAWLVRGGIFIAKGISISHNLKQRRH